MIPEWVQIPGFPYEVNSNGDVRDQDGDVRGFGRALFIYGSAHNRMRIAMHKIMRETFGDAAVDGVALKREKKF